MLTFISVFARLEVLNKLHLLRYSNDVSVERRPHCRVQYYFINSVSTGSNTFAKNFLFDVFNAFIFFRKRILTIFTARRKASFASAVYATVYPSVCPSHSGIVSKQGNAEGCGLHHQVAHVQTDGRTECSAYTAAS